MARTSPAAVRLVVDVPSGTDLSPFIEVANAMVTQHCSDSSYSAAILELIERWLSAHFYVVMDPRVQQEGVSGVYQQFEPIKVDLGLNLTKYGQQAMVLDYAGNLAALNLQIVKGRAAGASHTAWVGTEREVW